jgi:hypothetical protein
MEEIVQGFHTVYVNADALLPKKCRKLWVATAMLMARNVEGYDASLTKSFQGFIDGCFCLVKFCPIHGKCLSGFQIKTRHGANP